MTFQTLHTGHSRHGLFFTRWIAFSSRQDCIKIQSDLNNLSEWCERNSLFLNVDKCKTITFVRTRYPVEFAYMLAGTVLDRVSSINDLRVIRDEKMNFSEHVDVVRL
jgi:hypothetical protein